MRLTADFHSHSNFSDGHCTVDAQAARAKEIGLKTFAITDHGFTHMISGLRRKKFEAYRREIAAASEKHGVKALVGIEENILGRNGSMRLSEEELACFDVLLAGYHVMSKHETWRDWCNGWLGYAGCRLGIRRGARRICADQTKGYIESIKKNPIDILTHMGYRCYADLVEVAKCCGDYGTYVELSGRKVHFTDEELDRIVHVTSARFVLDSDAHDPKKLGDVSLAEAQIARVGVPLSRIDNIDGRMPVFRLAEYHKRG